MARFVRYVGPAIHFKGRSGIVLEKNVLTSTVLFIEPYNLPSARVVAENAELETYEPALAYPPVHSHETFQFLMGRWDVAEAWRMITAARPTMRMPVEKVDEWYDHYLAGDWILIDKQLGDIDLSIPVLFAQIRRPGEEIDPAHPTALLIDGWRRIYKAHHLRESLRAYALIPDEEAYLRLS